MEKNQAEAKRDSERNEQELNRKSEWAINYL